MIMRKKAMIMPWTFTITVPLIIVSIVVFALAIMFLSKMMSTTINVSSKGVNSDATLYAVLNTNDCAPGTKIPFKDILAVGIAQGKINSGDRIVLDYGGKQDGAGLGDPLAIFDPSNPPPLPEELLLNVQLCLSKLVKAKVLPTFFYFYVDQSASATSLCPDKKCFRAALLCGADLRCQVRTTPGQLLDTPLNTESVSYIALPNGDVSKVVLMTK